MSDTRWLTDYSAWPSKTRTWAPVAALIAFFLFWLVFGWHVLLSLILALLVLVAVVWFTRDTAAPDRWTAVPTTTTAPRPAPSPAPSVPPAAPVVDAPAASAEAAASERVRTAARAAGDAARLMDAPVAAVRPTGLDGPRGGVADDLKKIKGVGPKLELLLHSLGYYHFDQIGGWSAEEIAWVDSNLEGFNGRVTRDDWVNQARLLAAGGETEFSERVARGEVYDD